MGLGVFVLNDLAWFDINLIPGGHSELWAVAGIGTGCTSTWWFGGSFEHEAVAVNVSLTGGLVLFVGWLVAFALMVRRSQRLRPSADGSQKDP